MLTATGEIHCDNKVSQSETQKQNSLKGRMGLSECLENESYRVTVGADAERSEA